MIRTICILILSVLFNISYAEQSTSKLNNVDISCLAQLNDLKNNPTEEKLSGMLETLMANTSNSKLTLYTIEKPLNNNLQIIVEDQGVGIKKDKLDSIFKLQANKSTMGTYGEKGTGLGLIICNDFIKLMGGTIKVESTLNVGTKFIVNLPIN